MNPTHAPSNWISAAKMRDVHRSEASTKARIGRVSRAAAPREESSPERMLGMSLIGTALLVAGISASWLLS